MVLQSKYLPLHKDIVQLSASYNRCSDDYERDILKREQYLLELTKVINSLLKLLELIDEGGYYK